MIAQTSRAIELFQLAWNYVETAGFTDEVEWTRARSANDFTETDFLRETAWVLLCSGFRESVIRPRFDYISLSFCDWESSCAIVASYPACVDAASTVFRNLSKLRAIFETAQYVSSIGFESLKLRIQLNPLSEIQELPRIGSVTSRHLAKNLGFNVAKPDRHLQRVTQQLGYNHVDQLCSQLAEAFNTSISVVDTVLWRYLSSQPRKSAAGNEMLADTPHKMISFGDERLLRLLSH